MTRRSSSIDGCLRPGPREQTLLIVVDEPRGRHMMVLLDAERYPVLAAPTGWSPSSGYTRGSLSNYLRPA
jgi:hypothetical protein